MENNQDYICCTTFRCANATLQEALPLSWSVHHVSACLTPKMFEIILKLISFIIHVHHHIQLRIGLTELERGLGA